MFCVEFVYFFIFKQKTAYELRSSDWSSDVCSSDLFFTSERWQAALRNSVIVAVATTALATALGTLAALGLSRPNFPGRATVMALLISPMVVPIVITAVGIYFFYAMIGLTNSFPGLILERKSVVLGKSVSVRV